jgi:TolA-binding protein
MREAAQNGLVALAGPDYNPPGKTFGEPNAERRAERWRDYWQDFDRENVIGPRADSFLAMGTTLEEIGRPREASERYRRILDEYPSTAAADTARKRLKSMGRN